MTEHEIQDRLWYHTSNHSLLVVPNSNMFGWEADVLIITRALIAHEYEIKISRSDFFADAKKDKHRHITMWRESKGSYRHSGSLGDYDLDVMQPPNYFWYIVPHDLVRVDETPSFAGLMYVSMNGIVVMKKAPKLHGEHLTEQHLFQVCSAMNFRYWNCRTNQKVEQLESE